MIRFLIKGLLRDRQRSLIPILVVALGTMLTVVLHAWITGIMGESIEFNARFEYGHVSVMTQGFAEKQDQFPNEYALTGVDTILKTLQKHFPDMLWVQRIRFSVLIDVPDSMGETRAQGPAAGMGIDFFTPGSQEPQKLNLLSAIRQGRLPEKEGEILLSDEFCSKIGLKPGDKVTCIANTMLGGMSFVNFTLAGTVSFGSPALDRGFMIADIHDAQYLLDMEDAASLVLGFFSGSGYEKEHAIEAKKRFETVYPPKPDDPFYPVMLSMNDQPLMSVMLTMSSMMSGIIISVFVFAMALVLWNAGLLGGLRRYGEVGIRLAMGEEKKHIYGSMLAESFFIGLAGSLAGTILGLTLAWVLQTKGIDMTSSMKGMTLLMSTNFHARITAPAYYIGFIPGIFSTLLGTALSGIGIYRRQTATLFKEFEA